MKTLLLVTGHIGDGVILTGIVEAIGNSGNGEKIDVLTNRKLEPLFAGSPHVSTLYFSYFPIGSLDRFTVRRLVQLIALLLKLRRQKYMRCITYTSDVREVLIGRIVGAKVLSSPVWPRKHPFRRLIRTAPAGWLGQTTEIPFRTVSIYEAMALYTRHLGYSGLAEQTLYTRKGNKIKYQRSGRLVIGCQVFASQRWREWPMSRWVSLIQLVVRQGAQVLLFMSPSERERAEKVFGNLAQSGQLRIAANSLEDNIPMMATVDLFVGLDSMGIHVSNALGVKNIMLNGPNDFRIWRTPTSEVVNGGPACQWYPCYNKPKCLGSKDEFACMRSITVGGVAQAMDLMLMRDTKGGK